MIGNQTWRNYSIFDSHLGFLISQGRLLWLLESLQFSNTCYSSPKKACSSQAQTLLASNRFYPDFKKIFSIDWCLP